MVKDLLIGSGLSQACDPKVQARDQAVMQRSMRLNVELEWLAAYPARTISMALELFLALVRNFRAHDPNHAENEPSCRVE
jgi:hypothetical protein